MISYMQVESEGTHPYDSRGSWIVGNRDGKEQCLQGKVCSSLLTYGRSASRPENLLIQKITYGLISLSPRPLSSVEIFFF